MNRARDGARDGSHGHGRPFLERVLNNFDVSHQLAEQREAFLLHPLPCPRARDGLHHEEKLLLTIVGFIQAVDVQ